MKLQAYQRTFELAAVGIMIAGMYLMSKRSDPQHLVIYFGFVLLATAKLIEAITVHDPNFKILKITLCISIYLLCFLNIFYSVRSIIYIAIPLGVYYLLHYRLMFQQRKT